MVVHRRMFEEHMLALTADQPLLKSMGAPVPMSLDGVGPTYLFGPLAAGNLVSLRLFTGHAGFILCILTQIDGDLMARLRSFVGSWNI